MASFPVNSDPQKAGAAWRRSVRKASGGPYAAHYFGQVVFKVTRPILPAKNVENWPTGAKSIKVVKVDSARQASPPSVKKNYKKKGQHNDFFHVSQNWKVLLSFLVLKVYGSQKLKKNKKKWTGRVHTYSRWYYRPKVPTDHPAPPLRALF